MNIEPIRRSKIIFITTICISLLILGCQKRSKSAPFFDGLYLKYHEAFGNPKNPEEVFWTRDIEYVFKELDDGNFHVTQKVKTQRGKKLSKKLEPTHYPQVGDDLTIDKKGIVIKGGDFMNFIEGYPSYLWLPSNKRKKGAEFFKIVRKVAGKVIWGEREVWSTKGLSGDLYYYDVETGILIGSELLPNKIKMILTDTNHKILKSSLQKNMKI